MLRSSLALAIFESRVDEKGLHVKAPDPRGEDVCGEEGKQVAVGAIVEGGLAFDRGTQESDGDGDGDAHTGEEDEQYGEVNPPKFSCFHRIEHGFSRVKRTSRIIL